jgi:hypothetical protein
VRNFVHANEREETVRVWPHIHAVAVTLFTGSITAQEFVEAGGNAGSQTHCLQGAGLALDSDASGEGRGERGGGEVLGRWGAANKMTRA